MGSENVSQTQAIRVRLHSALGTIFMVYNLSVFYVWETPVDHYDDDGNNKSQVEGALSSVTLVNRYLSTMSVVCSRLLLLFFFLLLWCFTSTETVWLVRDGGRMEGEKMRAQAHLPVHNASELCFLFQRLLPYMAFLFVCLFNESKYLII